MTKVSRIKKNKRMAAYRRSQSYIASLAVCRNCGEKGPHFAPPGFGSPGFYVCQKKEED